MLGNICWGCKSNFSNLFPSLLNSRLLIMERPKNGADDCVPLNIECFSVKIRMKINVAPNYYIQASFRPFVESKSFNRFAILLA
jgi:hypothetical protein